MRAGAALLGLELGPLGCELGWAGPLPRLSPAEELGLRAGVGWAVTAAAASRNNASWGCRAGQQLEKKRMRGI